ncbi:MAG: hypothetical protein K9J43_08605, partial [Polynucleobacter sp.]|nr:hypothetical protein [Polynucleobacter sp.]
MQADAHPGGNDAEVEGIKMDSLSNVSPGLFENSDVSRGGGQVVRDPAADDGNPRVAIVGGGPAGMALALALKLH